MTINVIGAGAFGTALAISYASFGDVILWARSADHADDMQKNRQNSARLNGVTLPQSVTITANLSEIENDAPCLLAVPMQQLSGFCEANAASFENSVLIACCKGIDMKTGVGPVDVLNASFSRDRTGILSGPSFARDLANGLPTALTLAMADEEAALNMASRLSTSHLRIYASDDVRGVELGGALKNVMAIACGVVEGAGLGESARAAILTRGFAEMRDYAKLDGANPTTLLGLSGLGDLTLTASSMKSRNFRYGVAIGQGTQWDSAETVEGVATARALAKIAKTRDLAFPLIQVVSELVDGKITVETALQNLVSRPIRKET